MWRQRTDVDHHMAENRWSCERSKIADKSRLGGTYELSYPFVRFLGVGEQLSQEAERDAVVTADLARFPSGSQRDRATRIAAQLNVSESTAVRLIKRAKVRQQLGEEAP